MRVALLVLACLGVAALSLSIVPAAPAYDPLMWLLWGRELADGTLDTAGGPAFKPLPVAVCALLAPLGSAAPTVWLVLSRAGALLAVALAARLALPVLWLLPDALSTGEILRSASRARVPNPGQPALADVPALASLGAAAGLAFVPVCLGTLALRIRHDGTAGVLAASGVAWLVLRRGDGPIRLLG